MQNPATKAAIILILVSVSFMAAIATFPVFVHNTGTKSIGGLKPFCPDFTQWLENPKDGSWNGEEAVHGLGLIPAPVSVVGMSREDTPGIRKPGTEMLVTPTSLSVPSFSHKSAFSLV